MISDVENHNLVGLLSNYLVLVETVSLSLGKVIMQGRNEKGLTQKELATRINEKPQVINDYEAGRAIPNNQILSKVERIIGLKLRGKDKGKPMGGPKGKK